MRKIMITGTGHGMGQELARRAGERGDRVFATVLPGEDGAALEAYPSVTVLALDVGSDESVDRGFEEIDRLLAGAPLDLVIHCAGVSPSGALEVEPIASLERVLNINTLGTARVLRKALPRLRGHRGRIVLFSSLWGKVAGPMLSAYCASKHAIEAIVDATRRETHGQGLDIILIEPGVVRTNMVAGTVTGSRAGADQLPAEHRAVYGDLYERFARMIERESTGGVSVETAADVIEGAAFARRPKTRYRIGMDAKAVVGLSRLLPDRWFDSVFRSMLNR
jgi:NAD(P)-dependent dehydrogenase (short-subunit alcohol dehydrogenase family)